MMLTLLMLLIVVACVACLYTGGLWSNAVMFFNVVTAALLATNLFEWTAGTLSDWLPNAADVVALWGLFAVLLFVMRLATDLLSKTRVRFFPWVDQVGGIGFTLATGWVMVCFTMMSLHVAPLPRTAFGGAFMASPDLETKMLGVGPDRLWLSFVHQQAHGALGRGGKDQAQRDEAWGEFIYRYAHRRKQLEIKKTKMANR